MKRQSVLEFKKRIEQVKEKLSAGDLSGIQRRREEYTLERLVLRRRLWLKQRGKCAACGQDTHLHQMDGFVKNKLATYEHITPKSHGGRHDEQNGVITCHECNNKRGTVEFVDFVQRVKLYGLKAIETKSIKKNRRDSRRFYNYGWALHVFWSERNKYEQEIRTG